MIQDDPTKDSINPAAKLRRNDYRVATSRENTLLAVKILIFLSSSAEINLPPFHLDRVPPPFERLFLREGISRERERKREFEAKKKKERRERKKISDRNTEKRIPLLLLLDLLRPQWIANALLLRGGRAEEEEEEEEALGGGYAKTDPRPEF